MCRTRAPLIGSCIRLRASERRRDRKSTRLNSSHMSISYAVFCLKKKKKNDEVITKCTTDEEPSFGGTAITMQRQMPDFATSKQKRWDTSNNSEPNTE